MTPQTNPIKTEPEPIASAKPGRSAVPWYNSPAVKSAAAAIAAQLGNLAVPAKYQWLLNVLTAVLLGFAGIYARHEGPMPGSVRIDSPKE